MCFHESLGRGKYKTIQVILIQWKKNAPEISWLKTLEQSFLKYELESVDKCCYSKLALSLLSCISPAVACLFLLNVKCKTECNLEEHIKKKKISAPLFLKRSRITVKFFSTKEVPLRRLITNNCQGQEIKYSRQGLVRSWPRLYPQDLIWSPKPY